MTEWDWQRAPRAARVARSERHCRTKNRSASGASGLSMTPVTCANFTGRGEARLVRYVSWLRPRGAKYDQWSPAETQRGLALSGPMICAPRLRWDRRSNPLARCGAAIRAPDSCRRDSHAAALAEKDRRGSVQLPPGTANTTTACWRCRVLRTESSSIVEIASATEESSQEIDRPRSSRRNMSTRLLAFARARGRPAPHPATRRLCRKSERRRISVTAINSE